MKNKLYKIIGAITGILLIPSVIWAVQVTVPSAPSSGYIPQSVSTGNYTPASLTAGSNVTISTTTTNITISASGGGGTFPFTQQSYGVSTSTIVNFTNGLMANASSTINATLHLAVLQAQTIGNIRYADNFPGADCGAKINSALTDLGGGGQVWVTTSCGSTISTAITMGANQILQFAQCGTWTQSATITGGHVEGLAPYGGNCTILKQAASTNLAFMFRPTHQFDSIRDMEIDGTNGSNSNTIGVDAYRINGTVTEYDYIHNTPSYGWSVETASENSGESDVQLVDHNYFLLTGSDCMRVSNSLDAIIDQNLMYYCGGYGVYGNNAGGMRLTANDFGNATQPAIYATSTATGRSSLIMNIVNNRFGNDNKEDVYIDGYTGSGYGAGAEQISGNMFDGGSFRTSNTYDAIVLRDSTNNNVSNNLFSSNVGNTYKYGWEVINTGHSGQDVAFSNQYSGTFGTSSKNPLIGTTKDCDGVSCNLATLTTTGSVGVGTTTPGSLFSVGNTQGINFSTGTSTSNATGGFDLRGGGCFSISGTCIGGGGSGSGTVGTGLAGQVPYYAAGGTTLTATSTLFIGGGTSAFVGINNTTPGAMLVIGGQSSTTKSGGLYFGQDTVANLYRDASSDIKSDGTLTINGNITSNANVIGSSIKGTQFTSSGSNATTIFAGNMSTTNVGAINTISSANTNRTPTSGNNQFLLIDNGTGGSSGSAPFQPSSGTAVFNQFEIQGAVINQTGTAIGVTRGFYINPTLTRAPDFRAFETAPYTINLAISTTTLIGSLHNAFTVASTTADTVTNVANIAVYNPIAGNNTTISTSTALCVNCQFQTVGTATTTIALSGVVTTAYGLQVFPPVGATTNIGAQIYGTMFAPTSGTSGANQTGYWCYDTNGQFIRDTTLCLASARRFKKDIQPLDIGLTSLLQLKPVSFYYKDPTFGANQQMGFIADDVASTSAELNTMLVTYDTKGLIHGFDYEKFTALITKAIQDFYGQFQKLVGRVSGLEQKMNEQQKEIDSLQVQINQLKK